MKQFRTSLWDNNSNMGENVLKSFRFAWLSPRFPLGWPNMPIQNLVPILHHSEDSIYAFSRPENDSKYNYNMKKKFSETCKVCFVFSCVRWSNLKILSLFSIPKKIRLMVLIRLRVQNNFIGNSNLRRIF